MSVCAFQCCRAQIQTEQDLSGDGQPVFSATTLLGHRGDSVVDILARQLSERIGLVSDKPLLLSLSLKAHDIATLRAILSLLDSSELRLWGAAPLGGNAV